MLMLVHQVPVQNSAAHRVNEVSLIFEVELGYITPEVMLEIHYLLKY